jgi:Homeodomain-like domain
MLVVETIGRIRREHRVKGKSIKEIARDLKVSRNTVRKVLRSGATSFEYMRVVQPRPKLGAWHGDLDRMLSDNEAGPARERLTLRPSQDDGYLRAMLNGVISWHSGHPAMPDGPAQIGRYGARLHLRCRRQDRSISSHPGLR